MAFEGGSVHSDDNIMESFNLVITNNVRWGNGIIVLLSTVPAVTYKYH